MLHLQRKHMQQRGTDRLAVDMHAAITPLVPTGVNISS